MNEHVHILRKVLTVVCICFSFGAFAQITVGGKVTDAEADAPLPGVNVILKGTTIGTVTDVEGNYKVDVPETGTLVFSSIGFVNKEIPVNSRSTINVILSPDIEELQEVVVIGYGTQKKADLTGAVGSANIENLQKLPGADVSNLLQGQIAGVNAAPGTGAPGSDAVITVRGLGTWNNNEPLFIIDGVQGDINLVNPSDIQSIDVLKDGASAAIYGSRAANGVIIVTTKRGKKGEPKISLNTYGGVQRLDKEIDLANRAQYDIISNEIFANAGLPPLGYTTGGGDFVDTDWQDEFFQTGTQQKYDLGISGGNDFATYNFSLGYFDQKGIVINTGHERYNLRINSDFNKGKFKFGESLSVIRSTTDHLSRGDENGGYGVIYQVVDMVPHRSPFDPANEGGFSGNTHPDMPQGTNPIGTENLITNENENDHVQGNIYGEYEFIPGLSYRLRLGANIDNFNRTYHEPTYFMGTQNERLIPFLSEGRSRSTQTIVNNILSYDKTIAKHTFTVLAGYTEEKTEFKSSNAAIDNLPSNDIRALSAGTGDAAVSGIVLTNTLRSVLGRINYAYDDKYLFQANIRRDASSRFGEDNRWGTFSSFSAGWRISKEPFFASVPVITDLKLRAGWGRLGNQEIDDFLFLQTVVGGTDALNYVFGNGQNIQTGAIVTGFVDPDIQWETTTSRNIGLDMGLWRNRIQFTFDYFNNETSDMLAPNQIPATSGSPSGFISNIGDMSNKGVEFSLSYRQSEGDFKYNITGNLSHTKNEVTKLGFEGQAVTAGFMEFNTHPTTRTEVGGGIARFYLFQTSGIFQSQAEVDAHNAQGSEGPLQPNAAPGDFRFVDVNEDGLLNDDDKVFMGSGLPDFEYGFTFNASYSNFDVSLFIQGTEGNKMYNGIKRLTHRTDVKTNYSTDLLDAWTPQNTDTGIPRNVSGDPNANARPSDYFLEDASYLRIKNLQVGYTLPEALSGRIGIGSLRVYLSAENLHTFTDYSGFDPALNNFSLFRRGVDSGLYPLAKTYLAGLQLQF